MVVKSLSEAVSHLRSTFIDPQQFQDPEGRVRDGKVVAYHTYYDQLGLLTQLGLM